VFFSGFNFAIGFCNAIAGNDLMAIAAFFIMVCAAATAEQIKKNWTKN